MNDPHLNKFKRYTREYFSENPSERKSIIDEHIFFLEKGHHEWNAWSQRITDYSKRHKIEFSIILEDAKITRTDFRNYAFLQPVNFCKATFKNDLDFSAANFSKSANFYGATFEKRAIFDRVKFNATAGFEEVNFKQGASFTGSQFSSQANFEFAKFMPQGEVSFDGVKIFKQADFGHVKFLNRVTFRDAEFKSNVIFNEAVFHGSIFKGATFLEITDFTNSTFHCAPNFIESKINPDTDFSGVNFIDTKSRSSTRYYRDLKLKMGEVRATTEEQIFFALEQKSKIHHSDTSKVEKIASWIYWVTSDYGNSLRNPIIILAGILVLFGFAYFMQTLHTDVFYGPESFWTHVCKTIQFTITQITRPFYVWTVPGMQTIIDLSENVSILSIQLQTLLQSLLCLVSITLFLLAVRRKFRLT